MNNQTSITIKKEVRDELRKYKAEHGLTYDGAISQLLAETDWIDDATDLCEK